MLIQGFHQNLSFLDSHSWFSNEDPFIANIFNRKDWKTFLYENWTSYLDHGYGIEIKTSDPNHISKIESTMTEIDQIDPKIYESIVDFWNYVITSKSSSFRIILLVDLIFDDKNIRCSFLELKWKEEKKLYRFNYTSRVHLIPIMDLTLDIDSEPD